MDRNTHELNYEMVLQKQQLERYEKRLKDVVAAYKGLLKEKEALEASLAAITAGKADSSYGTRETPMSEGIKAQSVGYGNNNGDVRECQKSQIATLMHSLATVTAEKSRMEVSFQTDKRELRSQVSEKEKAIAKLQGKIMEMEEKSKCDIWELKCKWVTERQEREKETNNQMVMLRELQKLYADERHLRENLEMQLNNLKTQCGSNNCENSRNNDLLFQLKEAKAQLKQLQSSKNEVGRSEAKDNVAVLRKLQEEIKQLKEQHAVAIKTEQKRVQSAEERSKRLAAIHENRVANLEERLAELSTTVGSYDRLRQQDQQSIYELKRKLQDLEINHNDGDEYMEKAQQTAKTESTHNVSKIVGDIMRLKALLISENSHSLHPINLTKLFTISANHTQCLEEYNRTQQQLDAAQLEIVQLQEKLVVKETHITTLQEKVIVLNRNIDEQDQELKHHSMKRQQVVMDERSKWMSLLAEAENEYRCKLYEMEQQLQKQRQRSIKLLDEKEQEIKTLQTSCDVLQSVSISTAIDVSDVSSESYAASSDGDNADGDITNKALNNDNRALMKSKELSSGGSCHILHYVNEIARKNIEIAGLRKSRHMAEASLRKAIHEKIAVQEDLGDKIAILHNQVDRLERCKTREGASLEYLKNVIISFITTKDADGKQHMLNAISAVLQFTPNEVQVTNNSLPRK